MSGSKFQRMIDEWSDDQLADFLTYRYALLTVDQGNICTPRSPLSHEPFYANSYPFRQRLGSLFEEPWKSLSTLAPAQLLHPNPFELSTVRYSKDTTKCYRVWDAAVAVPACDLRSGMLYGSAKIPIVRNINDHWSNVIRTSFGHIGPLGPGGKVLRPVGPYVMDLTAMGAFGWTVREAIHVLAHLRHDAEPNSLYIQDRNRIAKYIPDVALEVAYSIIYDLPLDVTSKAGDPEHKDATYYGVRLKASTYIKEPVLRVPWLGDDALRVDETLAVMLGAVFIEPVPYGFLSSTTNTYPEDIWSMGPSLIVLVGWEAVDYITHMPLNQHVRRDAGIPDYAVRAEALLPPATHWAYLALAARDRPAPNTSPGNRWRYFKEWIASTEYQALRAQTPGLPCKDCYLINSDTDGVPQRPKGKHPKGTKKHWPHDWITYYEDVDRCLALVQKAVDDYEPLYYSKVAYRRLARKNRQAKHNKKLAMLKAQLIDAKELARAIKKVAGQVQGNLTPRQRRVYYEYEQEQRNASKQRHAAHSGG